ncbi:NAD(P)/FAD-dependent oxidoreductase [Roseobacter sinensis]|uniref:NAD(P)-binding protein n=1 Tax=Roseobacter sinensis TaxID=2931391 RepID=A0ABT3BEN8_9RHOB|nr:NAD(P)-binding protein [Roseobacter sp. WL0113]MCV3272046.1 NAD(P)-binding protein [Roseobacter sp. WL0113]
MGGKARIAIIGAGLTGLTLAKALEDIAEVTVFEKSRGLGGRMSTRRAAPFAFDHGAQYFSAKGQDFSEFLAPYLASGVVQPWAPRRVVLPMGAGAPPEWSAPRYVAVPAMTALAKALSEGLTIARAAHVERIARSEAGWQLTCRDGIAHGPFDWVISTAPAFQTAALMPEVFAGQAALAAARMQGCYSLMLGFATPCSLDWDAAWVREGPLAWIAVDTSKPGRAGPQSIVAQASNDWADVNLERDQAEVQAALQDAFSAVTGCNPEAADCVSLHRWRYANVSVPSGAPFLLDAPNGLAAAGDWCGAGKVEAAFESGSALAAAVQEHLG